MKNIIEKAFFVILVIAILLAGFLAYVNVSRITHKPEENKTYEVKVTAVSDSIITFIGYDIEDYHHNTPLLLQLPKQNHIPYGSMKKDGTLFLINILCDSITYYQVKNKK